MNPMKWHRLPRNSALWSGIAVGLAFRAFVYGLLALAPSHFEWQRLSALPSAFAVIAYWTLAFFSPFWVPFVGSFLSAYFWRHLQSLDYSYANRVLSIALVASILILVLAFSVEPLLCFGAALVYVDVGMSASGVENGAKFWNGRTGRQLLGDFSTRDDTF